MKKIISVIKQMEGWDYDHYDEKLFGVFESMETAEKAVKEAIGSNAYEVENYNSFKLFVPYHEGDDYKEGEIVDYKFQEVELQP